MAKLVANRLKSLLPSLVEQQKMGFVHGRHITDNILAVRLLQEQARKSTQPVAMLQLNYAKAYDRVDHKYLWAIMQAKGFSPEFIHLTRGLTEGSFSKVHFIGLFTNKFPLQRGVKQGCPLAPLLYALSTQPLMLLLKSRLASGQIQGVDIGAQDQVLFQLFADDTGLFFHASEQNFRAIMECLSLYERISGAKINLDKSTLLQLDSGPEPDWFVRASCSIAAPGQPIKYLGCPVGKSITPTQELNFVLDKLIARLRHWTHRFLSMASKLIALKHILRAMPVFHLMILDFSQAG